MADKKSIKKSAPKAKQAQTDGAFAVIETGGKQYVVKQGQVLKIEKLDLKQDEKVIFDKVLFHANGSTISVGTPHVSGAKVEAVIKNQGRGKKVLVMKYKQKSRYQKRNTHRQPFTQVEITTI